MSLRILHVIASVNPQGGGPVEGLKQIAEVVRRAGHDVEVACLDDPADPWVKSFALPCHALGPGQTSYRYAPRFVPWLRARRANYDCVVVEGLWQYGGMAVRKALRGSMTPYFVFTHGMLDPWFKRQYPLKHLKKWLYWPWAEYRVLRDARAVLFTCEEERRLARESFWMYRANEHVVKFGTAGPTTDLARSRAAFLARFPAMTNRGCVLFLGRVHPKKGADLLLRAYAKVRENGKWKLEDGPILVMAGPDDHAYGVEMKRLCEELGIADRVVWTGMLSGDLKWGAFSHAEVFVLTSHQENFGIAVAEALACGTPVLISDRVNIWREIQNDAAGLVDRDTQAGADRLLARWLALSVEEREQMSLNARKSFEERFHCEPAAASLIEAFKKFGVVEKAERETEKSEEL